VNESEEPSYYEVALTRRQVTVAFIVLLVCMMVSFLAGFWVARDGRPVPPSLVASTPNAAVEALPEYQFFSDRAGDVAKPGSAPPSSTAPSPDRAGEAEDPASTLLAEVGGAATPVPPSEVLAPESAEAGPAASKPARPAAQPGPALPPLPAEALAVVKASPPRPVPTPGSIYRQLEPGEMAVQVFSSADEDQARLVLRQLKAAGYTMFLSPVETGDKRMFRVRIGPYTDRATAQRVSDDVKRQFGYQPWIAK
jgi:DedD protein